MIKYCGTCLYGKRIPHNEGCKNPDRKNDWPFYSICQRPPCPSYEADIENGNEGEGNGKPMQEVS